MVEFSKWMEARKDEFQHHAFVIRNHGTYAWGKNLFEAKRHLETLEYLLEVNYKLKAINK
jgi:methylthioribulose-1-phosphate dehydratase